MVHKLIVFISSTADLIVHRDAVESVLKRLDIDGSRFEAWPPVPNPDGGMAECLRRVEEADAVILLLGAKYGTIVDQGLSATHQEYRHAVAKARPVFPIVLHADDREELQSRFVEEVQGKQFRGRVIGTITELKLTVQEALLQEFTRCFRKTHGGPPNSTGHLGVAAAAPLTRHLYLSDIPETALAYLSELYEAGENAAIQQLAPQIALKFGDSLRIMNMMFMAEVNLGMQGAMVDTDRINQAVEFWADPARRKLMADASVAFCEGNALGVLNRHQEAISRYEFALSKEPRLAPCWKNLGTAYFNLADPAAAKRCYLKAVELEPNLFEARYSLASMALDDREYQEALIQLDHITLRQLPPTKQSWVHGYKGKSYSSLGDHAEAISSIEFALSLAPDVEWPWFWAARIYALARRADPLWLSASREFGERMVCRFPNNGEAWGELGYTYWQLRLSDPIEKLQTQCVHAFSKAVSFGFTDNGLILDRLGHLYIETEDFEKAEAAFRQAVALDAASYGYCLGSCLVELERFADALEWLIAAAEKHQPDALGWGQLAFCYDKLGDRKNAIAAYEKAIQCDPDYSLGWFNLGGMQWNDGNRPKAAEVWREALQRFPDHELAPRVKTMLGIVE